MRTLWITGAQGFAGRHLATFMATLPDRPRIVGLDVTGHSALPVDRYESLDLCDTAAVETVARREPPAWIIHLAGLTSAATSAELWRANIGSALGVMFGVSAAGCRGVRLLTIGSAAEYVPVRGRRLTERSPVGPATEYGMTKLALTELTLRLGAKLGLHTCVARTFNLVGPGLPARFVCGRLCEQFVRAGSRGGISVRHTRSGRDFVDVRDAGNAYWRLVQCGRAGEVYNVCSGQLVMLNDVIERMSTLTGTQPRIRVEGPTPTDVDSSTVHGSFAKLQRETGWAPRIPLDRSLQDMLDHAAANQPAASRINRTRQALVARRRPAGITAMTAQRADQG